ncbi:hypothetical protein ABB37_03914 [Leptomonas pyrrhocoris]|uniref:Uncharacterized protein n=1 Tax=Leptomonas pyrrhocoris TaxID=157538 RepID=A0A0M9G3F8_LEPPY|nr:hypothetical protein ABB37_03914 [Leptomonas pyrrhocoris]KPA81575.1 hypothetical protein ABB37_03914 [Leptomonas pyrrhocoris]|eukprot:XP_015660014.1 hypothetical protein ABB37_03914 [Leptomonas pyrrhocoris]
MKVTLSLNRVLVIVVLVLSLPLYLDLSRLPSSADAQEYVFASLTACDGLRMCSLCGEVLEMVDLVQRSLVDPFTDELTLSAADWDLHNQQLYQRCVRDPVQRGCDTLVNKVKTRRVEYAKVILRQIIEDHTFHNRWGLLGEHYVVGSALRLTNYIFEAQERLLNGRRDTFKEDSTARSVVYQPSTLSLSGDPAAESLVTRVWFLRREVQRLHMDFCYPVCEGKLSFFKRLRLALARCYFHHSIKPRLLLLRQEHRGTLMVVELLMIGTAICVERMMRPAAADTGGGVVGMAASASGRGGDGGGVTHASSSSAGGGGAVVTGGGKGHYRQGRRR